jgi:hypothetical protein
LIRKYEKAKEEENDSFLSAVNKVHRKARLVLDGPGVKEGIRQFIQNRSASTRRKMYFRAFFSVAKFVERYGGHDSVGSVFTRTLTDIATPQNFRTLSAPDISSNAESIE